jgi:hypothetical protein
MEFVIFIHKKDEKVGFVPCALKKKHYFCKLRIMCPFARKPLKGMKNAIEPNTMTMLA